MPSVEITALFASLLAIMQIVFTLRVVAYRRGNKISLGDGADSEMVKRIRAHANFTETVPIALILLLLIELSGANSSLVFLLGGLLLLARTAHYIGVGFSQFKFRFFGMLATLIMIITSAAVLLGMSLLSG